MWFASLLHLFMNLKCVQCESALGSFLVSQKIRGVDHFRAFFDLGFRKAFEKRNESGLSMTVLFWRCTDINCPQLKEGKVYASSLLGGPGDAGAEHLFTYRVKFICERSKILEYGLMKQKILSDVISSGLLQVSVQDAAKAFTSRVDFIANTTQDLVYGPIVMTSALDVTQNISGLDCFDWGFDELFSYCWGDIVKRTLGDDDSKNLIQDGYGDNCFSPSMTYTVNFQSHAGSSDTEIDEVAERIKNSIDAAITRGNFSIRLFKALSFYSEVPKSQIIATELPHYSIRYVTVDEVSPTSLPTSKPSLHPSWSPLLPSASDIRSSKGRLSLPNSSRDTRRYRRRRRRRRQSKLQ